MFTEQAAMWTKRNLTFLTIQFFCVEFFLIQIESLQLKGVVQY